MSRSLPDAIPAATLVILRDRVGAPPDILMVERAASLAFAGGAMVFPGGRIDPGDVALAADLGGDDETAARIAAIRETVEETGLGIALHGGDPARLRDRLRDGAAIGAALAAEGMTLDPTALVPFARWRPAHPHARIFDTRFYLADADGARGAASADATETVGLLWTSAQAALDDADAGRSAIIFPTRRNLERLARYADFAAAAADAAAHPIRTVTPWEETRDGAAHLCIPDDLGYPVSAEPLTRANRG